MNRALPQPIRRAVSPLARFVRRLQGRPAPRPTLDRIGLTAGTDKASDRHNYLLAYENVIGHLRDETFQLVEIGVFKGASARMWAGFFEHAEVVGVDIHSSTLGEAAGRIRIVIGDQSDANFLTRFAGEIDPLIIVDDGSHVWEHQILTFRTLFPALRPGGFFFVEDIQTSFGEKYTEHYGRGYHETAYDYLSGIAEGIVAAKLAAAPRDEFEAYCRRHVESMTFVKHGIIVRKRLVPLA